MSLADELAKKYSGYEPMSQRFDVPVALCSAWIYAAVDEAVERCAAEMDIRAGTVETIEPSEEGQKVLIRGAKNAFIRAAEVIRALKSETK